MSQAPRIDGLRRALGLTPAEESLVRRSADRLGPEIEGWVDTFYRRLAGDPVAMALLGDEGRVIRLRRSLTAWLQEVLSLPLDAAYERTRREIGRTHARIGMPEYLMVTAMGGLRRHVTESVARLWGEADEEGWRVRTALGKVFDLELALMLDAYGRLVREMRLRRDRAIHAERTARRFARASEDAVDAALCWVELLEKRPDGARDVWGTRLRETLRALARPPGAGTAGASASRREPTRLSDLCARAVENVSLSSMTAVDVGVNPPDLTADLHAEPLQIALEELLQNAVNQAPGATAHLAARAIGDAVVLEVVDEGPGWPAGVSTVEDALGAEGGMGLSYCEFVAELHGGTMELFPAPGRGAGVRLLLPLRPRGEGGTLDAPVAAHSRRGPP